MPLIRYSWQYTNITNCTLKQPNKINAYLPENSPFAKFQSNFCLFWPLFLILASFQFRNSQENLQKRLHPQKTYRYTVAFWTECATVPFFVLPMRYSNWGSELLEKEGLSSLFPPNETEGIISKQKWPKRAVRCKREEKSPIYLIVGVIPSSYVSLWGIVRVQSNCV